MRSLTRRLLLSNAVAVTGAAALAGRLLPLSGSAKANTGDHLVEIRGFKFSPDKLRVRAGDRITWSNRDIAPHTATANDESWDTGEIKKGETKSMRVTSGMSGGYFCRFHPQMTAELVIIVDN